MDQPLRDRDAAASSTLGGDAERGSRGGDARLGGVTVIDCENVRSVLTPLEPWRLSGALLERIRADAAGRRGKAGIATRSHLVLFGKSEHRNIIRLIIISDRALRDSLAVHAAPERIAAAELRLLKQLICGLNLAAAAEADGVGYETKRSQYKSLARKLAARSQTELAARAMTQVLLDMRAAASGRPASSTR